jgi:hypothetical protein
VALAEFWVKVAKVQMAVQLIHRGAAQLELVKMLQELITTQAVDQDMVVTLLHN